MPLEEEDQRPGPILAPEEIKTIFGSLPDILEVHHEMMVCHLHRFISASNVFRFAYNILVLLLLNTLFPRNMLDHVKSSNLPLPTRVRTVCVA